MSTTSTTERHHNYDNACSMVMQSLKPTLGTIAPSNFTNGRNLSPKGEQDARLLVTAAVEGYQSPLWATPGQISRLECGAIISEDAVRVPIFKTRTSVKGNKYETSYDVVNLDCVSWPNGMPEVVYGNLMKAAANPRKAENYEFAAPVAWPKRNESKPETVRVQKKATSRGKLDKQDKQAGAAPGGARISNVVIDIKEFGIHVEARTTGEAQLMLDAAVKAALALR